MNFQTSEKSMVYNYIKLLPQKSTNEQTTMETCQKQLIMEKEVIPNISNKQTKWKWKVPKYV